MLLFAHPENTGTAHAQAPGKPGLAAAAALAVVPLENKQCMLVVVVTGVEDEELDELLLLDDDELDELELELLLLELLLEDDELELLTITLELDELDDATGVDEEKNEDDDVTLLTCGVLVVVTGTADVACDEDDAILVLSVVTAGVEETLLVVGDELELLEAIGVALLLC